jgi:Transcriptional regulator, AbiEi antitoxin, Type IV TA system
MRSSFPHPYFRALSNSTCGSEFATHRRSVAIAESRKTPVGNGVRQSLQEARELTHTLRSDVLRELLRTCTSIKTVRLCLQLGKEFALPWVTKLDPAELPLGSARPWVSRSSEGLLVIKR